MTSRSSSTSAVPDSAPPLPKGKVIAERYEVGAALGEGASGTVYEATRVTDGERVALKVIHRHLAGDRQVQGRAAREAAILTRLEGPHLVKLLETLREDDRLILVLEHVQGRSLERALTEDGPMPCAQAVEITLQICAALGAAHAAGVVHRDLKPGNVLLSRSEEDLNALVVRVVDFGLARILHPGHGTTGLTEAGMIFGTPEYMAPEQARGEEADARADIYAAGIMLYEMCAGRPPFSARTPIATMTAHLTEAPASPRSIRPEARISAALDSVILRAIAKAPEDRFPTARAFAEALSAARREREVVATPPPHPGMEEGDAAMTNSQIGHSPTIPSADLLKPAPPSPRPPASEQLLPPPPAKRDGLWTLVAILAVLAGVAVGLWIGLR